MIDSLPDRPLTNAEAERLREVDTRFVPLSILKGADSPYVIYTIAIYLSTSERVHLLGYSERERGWLQFESLPQEEWSVERQEETVQQWIDEQYGDEFNQGIVDEEAGEVRVNSTDV